MTRPFAREEVRKEPCPKCRGNWDPGSAYSAALGLGSGTTYRWDFRHVEAGAQYGDGAAGSYDFHWPEHLVVSCPECGYSFDMETADAKREAVR